MNTLVGRVVATVLAILLYGWINFLAYPVATLLTAQMAGKQLENSDVSYVAADFGMNFFGHLGIPFVVLLAVLAAIWWRPVRGLLRVGRDDRRAHGRRASAGEPITTKPITPKPIPFCLTSRRSGFRTPAPTRTVRRRSSPKPI